jgi:hypothetical protein
MDIHPLRRRLGRRQAEIELGRIRRRFQAITRRYERSLMIDRFLRRLRTCLIIGIVVLILLPALMAWAPPPVMKFLGRAASLVN